MAIIIFIAIIAVSTSQGFQVILRLLPSEINFTVARMAEEPEKLKESILVEARKAVEEDGAEAVVLGCTAESGFMKELIETLKVPVLDAVVTSWKYAEMMADLHRKVGLTHCKLYGYEPPPSTHENYILRK